MALDSCLLSHVPSYGSFLHAISGFGIWSGVLDRVLTVANLMSALLPILL